MTTKPGHILPLLLALQLAGPPAADGEEKGDPPVNLDLPALQEVRWQVFEEQVNYVVVDPKGRPWFCVKDKDYGNPQYVCHEAPGRHLHLRGAWLTLRVDTANRFWIATYGALYYFDLDTYRKVSKELQGLFGADGWPTVHSGQIWLGHSSARAYCHDYTGMHVFDGKTWSFHEWPADVLGAAGKIDLAKANFQAVEGDAGLTFIWARKNHLKGFWTHDGKLWRHYSSRRRPELAKLTAVVPMPKGFALICREDGKAFALDLKSGGSTAVPRTAEILHYLIRLGSKDPKIRGQAERVIAEIALLDRKKVEEASGFLAEKELRDRAMQVIRNAGTGRKISPNPVPQLPKLPLQGAELVVRTRTGDALLVWKSDGKTHMGILRPDGKIVETPPAMSLEFKRPYDEVVRKTADGGITILANGFWRWAGGKFARLSGDSFDLDAKLLGTDSLGRIYLEAVKNEHRRVKFDPRHKGASRPVWATATPNLVPVTEYE